MAASLVRDVAFRQHEGLCIIRIRHYAREHLYAWTIEWPTGHQSAPDHALRFHDSADAAKALADAWVRDFGHQCSHGCGDHWLVPSRFDC